jgi:predicted dinucleotide-binding enzyme
VTVRIGVLGTGIVGVTLGSALVDRGHEVRMGSRSADNPAAAEWGRGQGERASAGTFADAAAFGELVVNCVSGAGAVAAVTSAAQGLAGKLLIDVSNPLEFPPGGPPTLFVGITDSLGERVQRAVPEARVVKALNTMTCTVMVDPGRMAGDHVAFVCGDDPEAKSRTIALLEELGWPAERVLDIGDLAGARATEAYLLLWLRLMAAVGGAEFNVAVARRA